MRKNTYRIPTKRRFTRVVPSTYSAIHKSAGLTAHGRSEPKHAMTHACSCKKNGAGGCEITVLLSAFLYPFFSMRKSRRTEQPPGVILYSGFASFSVPIGWISHVIMHSNMASSLEKMEIIGFNNFEESVDMGNITASWPALGSLEKFKPKYIYYSYADLQYRKSLRCQRLMRDRQDPFFALGPNDICAKFKFYPHTIMDIVGMVAKDLQRTTKRNNPLTPQANSMRVSVCVGSWQVQKFTTSQLRLQFPCTNVQIFHPKFHQACIFASKTVCWCHFYHVYASHG